MSDVTALGRSAAPPSTDWETPRWLVELVEVTFRLRFTLDAAAEAGNTKCEHYLSGPCTGHGCRCGLCATWEGDVWCNPPYGPGIGKWVEKAIRTTFLERCTGIALLVPASTDTAWFRRLSHSADIFLLPRIQFIPPPGRKGLSNRYTNALAVFEPARLEFRRQIQPWDVRAPGR